MRRMIGGPGGRTGASLSRSHAQLRCAPRGRRAERGAAPWRQPPPPGLLLLRRLRLPLELAAAAPRPLHTPRQGSHRSQSEGRPARWEVTCCPGSPRPPAADCKPAAEKGTEQVSIHAESCGDTTHRSWVNMQQSCR